MGIMGFSSTVRNYCCQLAQVLALWTTAQNVLPLNLLGLWAVKMSTLLSVSTFTMITGQLDCPFVRCRYICYLSWLFCCKQSGPCPLSLLPIYKYVTDLYIHLFSPKTVCQLSSHVHHICQPTDIGRLQFKAGRRCKWTQDVRRLMQPASKAQFFYLFGMKPKSSVFKTHITRFLHVPAYCFTNC